MLFSSGDVQAHNIKSIIVVFKPFISYSHKTFKNTKDEKAY